MAISISKRELVLEGTKVTAEILEGVKVTAEVLEIEGCL